MGPHIAPRARLAAVLSGIFALASLIPSRVGAVRPFVTDDARIVDEGQLEIEMWPELVFARGGSWFGYNVMGGVGLTPWLEILAGGGAGVDHDGRFTAANPIVQPKLLLVRAQENGVPGLALVAGVTLPWGRGEMHDDATGAFVLAPITSRLFHDWLQVHANVGVVVARRAEIPVDGRRRSARPFWGVGADAGLGHEDVRLVLEIYAGDPFHALGPKLAFQGGFRWLASDRVNFDLTAGAQPLVEDERRVAGEWESWVQLGVRLVFDVFTDGPGDPQGGAGMVVVPRRRR
ncbi:MAG: transporter [Myxococcales bacterium]|nr:transporter [Myxococcales bacterium]